MVRLAAMREDYYQVEKGSYSVKGEKKQKRYTLGDTVRVRLTAANLEERTIDFALVG